MISNLESAGAAGTVGNVCLDVKDSEVSQRYGLVLAGVPHPNLSSVLPRKILQSLQRPHLKNDVAVALGFRSKLFL